MPIISFLPDDIKAEATEGKTLLEIAVDNNLPITHVCGGRGRCSTCRVIVTEGLDSCTPRTADENSIARKLSMDAAVRLACQTKVQDDVSIRPLVLDERDVELTSLLITRNATGLTGTEKNYFILFADIREFTPFAEGLMPYDTIHVLNRYFHEMNEAITRNRGRINNFMGDGLLALFEAHDLLIGAVQVITAGLEMLNSLRMTINPYMLKLFGKTFKIGIGIHYGLMVEGSVRFAEGSKITVVGDSVNLASRIESANKTLDSQFLISEDVYELIPSKLLINRTVDVDIPGKSGRYRLYEVVGLKQ